jgi:quinol-cytochrome oxidoreductase complex cytochrome b subunit
VESKPNSEPTSFRKVDNLHIVLWLIKDMCWVSDFKVVGLMMVIPTILVAFWIAWINRSDKSDFAHNLAVCCWICANSVWMFGEFYCNDTTRPFAKVFFVTGLVIIAAHYAQRIAHWLRATKK